MSQLKVVSIIFFYKDHINNIIYKCFYLTTKKQTNVFVGRNHQRNLKVSIKYNENVSTNTHTDDQKRFLPAKNLMENEVKAHLKVLKVVKKTKYAKSIVSV